MPLDEQSPPPRNDKTADEAGHDDSQDSQRDNQQRRDRVRPFVWIGLIVLALAALTGGAWYWWATKDEISTDDAFVDGRAVGIAPHVSGYVISLDIADNEFVQAGQPLVHIDPRDYIAARDRALGTVLVAQGQVAAARYSATVARQTFPGRLAAAEAALAKARADLFKAQTDDQRQRRLPRAATTQEAVDTAAANLQAAQAQVAQATAEVQQATPVQPNIDQADSQVMQLEGQLREAKAQLAQAELNLSWCVVTAPSAGWVTKRAVERGDFVQQGQQIMSLVDPGVWITANFKETQLDRLRPGQSVRIAVDAYPGLDLRGHVNSVQQGSGAKFSAFPPENATGNFVKIVQRVPVKIVIDSGLDPAIPLPLGTSVEPTVTLR